LMGSSMVVAIVLGDVTKCRDERLNVFRRVGSFNLQLHNDWFSH